MKLLQFAAIDIGSNAVRLLFSNVIEDGKNVIFKKSSLVRVPVRLGDEAFTEGKISQKKIDKLIKTMIAFKHLMEVHEVVDYEACATSAMREASNSAEIVERVKKEVGIEIQVIDGKKEAEILYSNQIVEMLDDESNYLYVDVGGGSTEITLFSNRKLVDSFSFNIGTIRLFKGQVSEDDFKGMKRWLKGLKTDKKEVSLIGSGGNINKIFKISGKKDDQPLTFDELSEIYKFLSYYSYDELIKVLGLNPDRAEVIVPATEIFLKVMKWTGAKRLIVPTIGISDGIIHHVYSRYKSEKKVYTFL